MSTEESIVNAITTAAAELRAELHTGFAELSGKIDQTNARLDQTNARLDQTNARLDQTNARLDQTNTRLDQQIERLDQKIDCLQSAIVTRLDRFEEETSKKLDGISQFLIASERGNARLESRIISLERRVGDIEGKQKPA